MSQPQSLAEQLEALVNGGARPTWDEYFMATAVLVSSRSSCERLHVGCIIVSTGKHPNRLVAAGYNGFLPGAPPIKSDSFSLLAKYLAEAEVAPLSDNANTEEPLASGFVKASA